MPVIPALGSFWASPQVCLLCLNFFFPSTTSFLYQINSIFSFRSSLTNNFPQEAFLEFQAEPMCTNDMNSFKDSQKEQTFFQYLLFCSISTLCVSSNPVAPPGRREICLIKSQFSGPGTWRKGALWQAGGSCHFILRVTSRVPCVNYT